MRRETIPSSKNYKDAKKNCEVCDSPLVFRNNRDVKRKRFCSVSCRNSKIITERKPKVKVCHCGGTFSTQSATQKSCSSECAASLQVGRSYKMMHNNPEKYLQHALYKKGRESLTVPMMLKLLARQNNRCAISGKKMTFTKVPGSGRINTNCSIDQIEAGGGYTEENVQLVCDVVNRMKIDMDISELKFWCRAILED